MARSNNIFTRVEKKYSITDRQYAAIEPMLFDRMHIDEFGLSTVCSVYFDAPDNRIVRASIDKPVYKEKLRLRCYGVPDPDSEAFIELKKKYKGIVYKRRIFMPYEEAVAFLSGHAPMPDDQIAREIAYALKIYPDIAPAAAIFCERIALYDNDDENLRITIDSNLRYRVDDMDLTHGTHGNPLLPADKHILEIKTAFSMPLWLTKLLDDNSIYPSSFSKYGTAYRMEQLNEIGGHHYAQ